MGYASASQFQERATIREHFLTFSLFELNWATASETKESILLFETFSRNKKHCSSRDEKASQILAIFSHATFVSKVGINMNFEKYSSIYPDRGFSPNPQCFQGCPQYSPPFPPNPVSSSPCAASVLEYWRDIEETLSLRQNRRTSSSTHTSSEVSAEW